MALTTATSGNLTAYEGTLQEVLDALNQHNTHPDKIIDMFSNGTNYTALVWGN